MPPPGEFPHVWDVYARQLWKLGRGLPLWEPEPSANGEVLPGDVGYMRQGGFYRIFNTIDRPRDERDGDLPAGFECFELKGRRDLAIQKREAVMEAGFHSGRTIKQRHASASAAAQLTVAEAGASYSFECSDKQGAIAFFKHPVAQTMLHSNPRQYILRHFDSWVRFAIDTSNLDIHEDELMFIRGFVKGSTQWAVAAVTHNDRSGTFSMNAGVLPSSGGPSAAIGFHGSETSQVGLEKRQNPRDFVVGDTREDEIPEGQCFFVNYFKVRRRRWFGFRKIEAAAEPHDPSDEDTGENDGGDVGTVAGQAQEDLEILADSDERKPWDPVDDVLAYILSSSEADIAIASDSVITILCELNDEDFPDDVAAFLNRVKPDIVVNDDKVGVLQYEDVLFDEVLPADQLEVGSGETSRNNKDPTDEVEDFDEKDPDKEKANDATRSADLIEVRAHGQVIRLQEHTDGVSMLACSPDGKWVVGVADHNSLVRWDASSGELVRLHPSHQQIVTCLTWSSDSTLYVSAAGPEVTVWNLDDEQPQRVLSRHNKPVHAILFHPSDSTKLVTSGGDTTVDIWDVTTGEQVKTFRGHHALVNALAFSNDGKRLLSGAADERIIVWDIETEAVVSSVMDNGGAVWSVADSNDGRRFVSCSDEGTSQIWSTESEEALAILGDCNGPVGTVRFSPDDGRILAVCKNPAAVVYDSYTGDKIFEIATEKATFSPDGKWLAGQWKDSQIRLWDATDGKVVKTWELPAEDLHALLFTPDSQNLISSGDNQILLWPLMSPV